MSEIPEEEDMERLLRQLRPLAPNPEMREKVSEDLKLDDSWLPRQVRRAPRWLAATGWAGLGAAAAVVVLSVVQPRGEQGEAETLAGSQPAVGAAVLATGGSQERGQPGRVWSVEKRAWIEARGGEALSDARPTEVPEPRPRAVLPVNFQ